MDDQAADSVNASFKESDTAYWEEFSDLCPSTECEDEREDFVRDLPSDANLESNSTRSLEVTTLAAQLALWAIQVRIPLQHLSSLLCILHQYHSELPRDARTLLSTPRCTEVDSSCGGEYVYLGILSGIKRLIDRGLVFSSDRLNLQINVDGLPLYHSQSTCFWPILVAVTDCKPLKPFAAAVYCGKSKPNPVDTFLAPFISEMKVLMTEGFSYLGRAYSVALHSLVCDTPARAFLKCIKGHTGYHACEKCVIKGKYSPQCRKVVYMQCNAEKRDGASFSLQKDPRHHHGVSPLLSLEMDLVAQVPLDSMHLVYLGVVKKIVTGFWLSTGVTKTRLSQTARQTVSDGLLTLRTWIPREFNRKPRPITDTKMWKATEWRQFLLYTGPLVLKKVVDRAVYNHFLALSAAVYILSKHSPVEMLDVAESLLYSFVAKGRSVYGKEIYVLNFHSLIHIVDDVRRFGALDTFSCFPFENYLKDLKHVVRSPHKPLSQVVNRITEEREFCFKQHDDSKHITLKWEHDEGPLSAAADGAKQYKRIDLPCFCVCTNSDADCTVQLRNGSIVVVRNILEHNGRIVILGSTFKSLSDFYRTPVASSLLGIHFANELCDALQCWDVDCITCKVVRFPISKGFLVIPLLHTA
ncbi:uncharacterized protein LOC135388280 [Ornithodoros turicata]|uniref:uncharacterized protein LOC135388280 n=1 Tax=Ornithodoros turicata TaxID=34597 RepID=UPI003139E30E